MAVNIREEPILTEQRVLLRNVSWITYQRLVAELQGQSTVRLVYDQGILEIMTPLPEHERINRTISLLVEVVAEELDIDIENLGSTTFKRDDLERGFEADTCFYVKHEVEIKGKAQIDLAIDPPPDLVIEVDMTSSSMNKLPMYAQLGVAEVWHFEVGQLKLYGLAGQQYSRLDRSEAFPILSEKDIANFIEKSKRLKRTVWLKELRQWIRQHSSPKTAL